jgi:membrane-associated protease RseP (regulator of RpoE activity)
VSSNSPADPQNPYPAGGPSFSYPEFIAPPLSIEPSRREWIIAALLFAATFVSTTFAGVLYARDDVSFLTMIFVAIARPSILLYGLPFSFTFIMILLAHELGHFFACRYYGIRCTPPYFLPFPISIAGTLGAFIRIKSPFQNKRALFDVGVAGPLAGFAFVVPALFIGISHSQLIPKGSVQGGYSFGEPIIFRLVGKMVLDYSPERQDMFAHPIAMAAWFGLLATSLNLFPIWQLDGGHIAYAILGRDLQKRVSIVGAIGLIAVSFAGWPIPSYLVFGGLLLIFGLRNKFFHPATLCDAEEIGPRRIIIGMLALLILVLCFTAVPISIT